MHDRKETSQPFNLSKLFKQLVIIAEGTGIGVFGRWATWFGEKGYYDKADINQPQSYSQIYRNLITPQKLRELNRIFFRTGLRQTVGKSASNMGVINWVEYNYPYLSPFKKTLLVSCISTPLETSLTSYDEWLKVRAFRDQTHPANSRVISAEFARVFLGSGFRIGITSLITFGSIYSMSIWMKNQFPQQDSAKIKGLAAGLASFAIQPLNMPFINFQTWVMLNSHKPAKEIVGSFYQSHHIKDLFAGSLGRSIHRAAYYSLTFFLADYLKKFKSEETHLKRKIS